MGCSGRSSGGCGSELLRGCKNDGSCGNGRCNKLSVFDWLSNIQEPTNEKSFNGVEVRFKRSRKEFYNNSKEIPLQVGDVVVQSNSGHDVGVASIDGALAKLQMKKKVKTSSLDNLNIIYRKAKDTDIQKWKEAVALENETMHGARKSAELLGLKMKISDVEYQGDKSKATFYYTTNGRVDFRELIKSLHSQFKINIEMRQIGVRQETAKLGGIGACGRELCCSSWLTDFRSVNTSAARYQQLSINPQKLAGQCGILKCCLNYELDGYMEGIKEFPSSNLKLKTKSGDCSFVKMDIFKRKLWYSCTGSANESVVELPLDYVNKIIEQNTKGVFPKKIEQFFNEIDEPKNDYENVVGQDNINRFDIIKKMKKKDNKRRFYKRKKKKIL
tara:strand:- start:2274 stop:3434 length:1161 start_codon:yes stop_codon:yes gene_type:complete